MEILISFLVLIVIALQLMVLKKLKRIDLEVWSLDTKHNKIVDQIFCQVEALFRLNQLLELKHPLPATRSWAGSPDFLLEIAQHALKNKPKRIFECSSGVSTITLARCVEINGIGHIFSFESDPVYAQKTRDNLKDQGLTNFATVLDAPLVSVAVNKKTCLWYDVSNEDISAIDMLVIDGPPAAKDPEARFPAGPILFKYLNANGVAFLDDANRVGEKSIIEQWLSMDKTLKVQFIDCEKGLAKITHLRVE